MTLAYVCIIIAMILPILLAGYAKVSTGFKSRHNSAPREFLERAEGKALRARWAEQNTYEALPGFFTAVVVAHQLNAPQHMVDILAMAFIALRLVYAWCYINDYASLRSLVWLGGLGCSIALVVIGFQ